MYARTCSAGFLGKDNMAEYTRSRAAILPYPGDPFLLNYWLTLFDRFWSDEVDKLYIYANSPIFTDPKVKAYVEKRTNHPKIHLIVYPEQVEHGEVINRTLDAVQEDLVMLVEDDGFIFKKGVVDWAFSKIEIGEADIVASKRGSCGLEISKRAQELWGLAYEGEGDQGCNFWPNFFFTKKEILTFTDRNFGARMWKAGERIEALNYVCETDQAGDTLVNTSLQLRAMNYRIATVPQYHGHPMDLEHYRDGKYLFDGQAPWTHIGSLSSGIGGILRDEYDRPLSRSHLPLEEGAKQECQLPLEWCKTDMERGEWERRIQWWLKFYQDRQIGEIEELAEKYINAIDRVIYQYKLNRKNINKRQRAYATLGL